MKHARHRLDPWLRRGGSLVKRTAQWLICLAVGWELGLAALPIAVPNASFESPSVAFVSIEVAGWQKTPKPDWYVEDGGFFWTQLTGVFRNPAPGALDRLDNCDGNQAVWVFAVPGVGLFQEFLPAPGTEPLDPTSGVARFRVGSVYQLTAGVIGGGGGMSNGVPLQLSLYYRDTQSNRVDVATQRIIHSRSLFPTLTHLIDFTVTTPEVKETDPWVNQPLAIAVDSVVGFDLQGGYWDLDHVRLIERSPLRLESPLLTGGGIRFTIRSEPGLRIAVQAGSDLARSGVQWTTVAQLTNTTGVTSFSSGSVEGVQRFYRAEALAVE